MERLTGLQAAQVTSAPAGGTIVSRVSEINGIEYDLMQRALQGESTQSGDVEFSIEETGKCGWISCAFEPHRDGKGEIIGIIAVVSDVSDPPSRPKKNCDAVAKNSVR